MPCLVRPGMRLLLGGRHSNLERQRAQALFGLRVPEIITGLSAFTQHISLEFSVKCFFIMSVIKV